MSFFNSMQVSASGLTAQRLRMDVIAENMANVNTTRTADGGPYRRRTALFEQMQDVTPFSTHFNNLVNRAPQQGSQGRGVRVSRIAVDNAPGAQVYDPAHPDANAAGYVTMPNVNTVMEMVNMISASRSYEANVTAMNTVRGMMSRTLDIGR